MSKLQCACDHLYPFSAKFVMSLNENLSISVGRIIDLYACVLGDTINNG